MKKTVFIFFCLVPVIVFAQRDATIGDPIPPKAIVKFSPLHLLNYHPTLQLAIEYRITPFTSIQLDGGPVVKTSYEDNKKEAWGRSGFKLKGEVRYYLTRKAGGWRYYLAPEVYYNTVDYKKSRTFGINCETGDCDYFQYITYRMEYRESGLNFKFGGNWTVHRFCLDYHVGLAARFIRYTAIGKPAGPMYREYDDSHVEWDFLPREESRNIVQPTTCIRIGYVLK